MRPPKLIKPYVASFSRQVIGTVDAMPFYIPCAPLHDLLIAWLGVLIHLCKLLTTKLTLKIKISK